MQAKRDFQKRLNYVIGQLEGIKRMVEAERDCVDVLQQLKAAKSGLENAMSLVVQDEICCSRISDARVKNLIRTIAKG